MRQTVAYYTLGCKLNFSETSTIARQLDDAGFSKVAFEQGADIYVINTCSVTENADRKCGRVVREALRHNPEAFVAVIGCYAQLKPEKIASIPGVDLVLGAAEKFNISKFLDRKGKKPVVEIHKASIKELDQYHASYSLGERTRSFLKIQDGCDYFCSFCTIPMARGKSRSATIEHTVEMAKKVAASGIKEMV